MVVALTVPAAVGFGQGAARYYGWYTSAEGSLHTGLILDQVQYTRLVDATAGRAPSSEVAPFTARALAPWLAGRLPLEAHVALTLVNLACLAMGTFALARLAMDLTRRRGAVALAVAVWAVSFPVVKYTGDAFVDPAAVGLVPVVLLAIRRRWLVPALAVFAAAVWMKETALVLLAVGLATALGDSGRSRARRPRSPPCGWRPRRRPTCSRTCPVGRTRSSSPRGCPAHWARWAPWPRSTCSPRPGWWPSG